MAFTLLVAFHQLGFADTKPAQIAAGKARATLAEWADDAPSWKERMRAMVWCAKAGPAVVSHLTKLLKKGTHQQRLFAAEALSLFATTKARRTLLSFLEKEENAELLRVFADKTISYLGHVQPANVAAHAIAEKTGGVRQWLFWAWRQEQRSGIFRSVRKQLANYDLARMDSAGWCRPAPDFVLRDVTGKTWRLGDFRDKKYLVLVFIDTQT